MFKPMKKFTSAIPLAIVVVFIALTSSCDKLDELLTFTVTDHTTITIEGNSVMDLPLQLPTPDVTSSANQEFSNNNTRADLVKDVKLTEMTMEVTSPEGKTFSFLKSIEIYISTDGSDKVLLASQTSIPETATLVQLETSGEKLDKYLKAESYRLHTTVVTREAFASSIEIELGLKFRVTADPL
jgi:hypothetical protein